MAVLPERVDILGVRVHPIDLPRTVERLAQAVVSREKGYVCVTGVHGIMEAQGDEALTRIHNESMLTVPDGMPTVWIGRAAGHRDMRRVYGPDLMLEVCRQSVEQGWTHFFYGGREGVAGQLKQRLQERFPGLDVVGTYTPPFRALNSEEAEELRSQVARTRPDFFWVGLSTPKQERFMTQYLERLDTTVMLGVGAAFDVHTGAIKDAPAWVKNTGLQWLHRMIQEPKRLGPRYLSNNPRFMLKYLAQRFRPSHS